MRPRGEQNAEAARILSEELQRRFNEEAVGARRQLRAVLFVMEHALRSALSQATVPKELLQELDAELDERGQRLFRALVIEERATDEVAHETGMTRNAIYSWTARLGRKLEALLASRRQIAGNRRQ